MKTALLLIPQTDGKINRTSYLNDCMREMTSMGYFPITYDIYQGHIPITQAEFIWEMLPKADEVFIFCDFSQGNDLRQMVENAEPGRRIINITQKKDRSLYTNNLQSILREVAQRTQIPVEELKSRSRKREVCDARFVYYRRARQVTTEPLRRIGQLLGRDHATVHYGINEATNTREVAELYINTYNDDNQCE